MESDWGWVADTQVEAWLCAPIRLSKKAKGHI